MTVRSKDFSTRKGRRNASAAGSVEALESRRLLSGGDPVMAYQSHFDAGVDAKWSGDAATTLTTSTTPVGARPFLGPFGGDEAVTLSLDNLPAHDAVLLVYKVFLIGSWNGNAEGAGGIRDSLAVEVEAPDDPTRKQTLSDDSFSNTSGSTQSYGGRSSGDPDYVYPATTGAKEVNTLGFYYTDPDGVQRPGDAVYYQDSFFGHDGATLNISFRANLSGTRAEESLAYTDLFVILTSGTVDLDVGVPDATESSVGRYLRVNDDFDEYNPNVPGDSPPDYANGWPEPSDGELVHAQVTLNSGRDGAARLFFPTYQDLYPTKVEWCLALPAGIKAWWLRTDPANQGWQRVQDGQHLSVTVPATIDLLIEADQPGLGKQITAFMYEPNHLSASVHGHVEVIIPKLDGATLHALDPDLDADTDHDGIVGRTWQEEIAEDSTGLDLGVNDAAANGAPGYANFTGAAADVAAFSKVLVELPAPIDPSAATVRFDYNASDPSQLGAGGVLPAAGDMRLWRRDPAEDRDPTDAATGGDFLAAGVDYPLSALGITAPADHRVAALWLEGVRELTTNPQYPEQTPSSPFYAQIDPDGPNGPAPFVAVDNTLAVRLPFTEGNGGGNTGGGNDGPESRPAADLDVFEDVDGNFINDNSDSAEIVEADEPTYLSLETAAFATKLALVLNQVDPTAMVALDFDPTLLSLWFDEGRTNPLATGELLALSRFNFDSSGTAVVYATAKAEGDAGTLTVRLLQGTVTTLFPAFLGTLIGTSEDVTRLDWSVVSQTKTLVIGFSGHTQAKSEANGAVSQDRYWEPAKAVGVRTLANAMAKGDIRGEPGNDIQFVNAGNILMLAEDPRNDRGLNSIVGEHCGFGVHGYGEGGIEGKEVIGAIDAVLAAIRTYGVTTLAFFGYSHGASSVRLLTHRLAVDHGNEMQSRGVKVAFTAYIDGVRLPGDNETFPGNPNGNLEDPVQRLRGFGRSSSFTQDGIEWDEPEFRYPYLSQYHVSIFQRTPEEEGGLYNGVSLQAFDLGGFWSNHSLLSQNGGINDPAGPPPKLAEHNVEQANDERNKVINGITGPALEIDHTIIDDNANVHDYILKHVKEAMRFA